MFSAIMSAITLAVSTMQQMQYPLPPTIGLPKPVHEPKDVRVIPVTNQNR